MLKDITLGQYFPGTTPAHRLDPRTKLILVVLYIIALFAAESFVSYGLMVLTLCLCVAVSKVPPKSLIKGLKPVLFILIFTALLNVFYTPGRILWQWWIFRVTIEGIFTAFFMALRISLLIMGTFLMTYTTSPIMLTDGMESLMNPLKKLHVPVHELAMMLFISAFRRADELAVAMECRCYHGGEGRTKLKVLRYRGIDYTAFSLGALILAGVIVLARFGL